MLAGVLLATRGSIDELDLRGLGSGLAPAGIAMGIGGLLLGGAPWGVFDAGSRLVATAAWVASGACIAACIVLGTALTGATVLRAAGRIFLGLGPQPDPEEVNAPSAQEQEKADRPLWLMLAPCLFLLGLTLVPGHLAEVLAGEAVGPMAAALPGAGDKLPEPSSLLGWLAVVIAAYDLCRERIPRLAAAVGVATRPGMKALEALHSGVVCDYVVWIAIGLGCFSLFLAFR